MSQIHSNAPCCGDVTLEPEEISLFVYDIVRPGIDGQEQVGTYVFDCPKCGNEITKPADLRIAGMLLHGCVEIDIVPRPLDEEAVLDFRRNADSILDRLLGR